MPFLFIIFVVIPVIEITILIKVGQAIGGWYTVGIVLLSAFIGVNMLRYQGVSTLLKARSRIESGEMPLSEMRDGIIIAIGGALLITPGFVTDAVGFACLLPFTRGLFFHMFGHRISAFAQKNSHAHFHSSNMNQHVKPDSDDEIIDAEYTEINDRDSHTHPDDRRLN